MRKILMSLVLGMVLASGSGAWAQESDAFTAKYNAVLSRLQSMGHGYYSEKEWAQIDESVDDLVQQAAKMDDGEAIVKAAVIKAMVLSDMRRRHAEAVRELVATRKKVARMEGVDASKLYVKEAEVQAEAGDAAAVQAVIAEYKASKYYDPKPYAWSGGTKPGDPLLVARPGATGGVSLPLTINPLALPSALFGVWRNSRGEALDILAYKVYRDVVQSVPPTRSEGQVYIQARRSGIRQFAQPTAWAFWPRPRLPAGARLPFLLERRGWYQGEGPDGRPRWVMKCDADLTDADGRPLPAADPVAGLWKDGP